MDIREIRHFHLFGAIGGGAQGFNRGTARVGNMVAKFRCIGSIDVDAAANRDFERRIGVKATTMDLFDRDQYVAFHGKEPPAGWREATTDDIQRAAGFERPHIVFLSAPCKGFSGLLSENLSKTGKYQALNRLTLRGVWLMLEAFKDDPVELVVFENVPRIANRGRHLLDQIVSLLQQYGYAVAETTHDCGELGGLAQSRKRFLLVARHTEKVPPFLYEPDKKSLQSVGTVLGRMPMPGDAVGGPMHRIPSLHWKTWVRLAFVEAGSDWRSLNKLRVEDGHLKDFLIVPEMHNGTMGVVPWESPMGTVTGNARPLTGNFSVADPRAPSGAPQYQQFGVMPWDSHAGTIIGIKSPGQGTFSVADPRTNMRRGRGDNYLTGGHYGVVPWNSPCGAVSSAANLDNGRWSVSDPRTSGFSATNEAVKMPAPNDKLVCRILSIDGTWHRPFTTLELAALQSLVDPEEYLELDGMSDQAWRERIGNAVPPKAAEAIAGVMGTTLLLAWSGETFLLSSQPIWVRPVATALSVARAV